MDNPPSNLSAEQALCGSALFDNRNHARAAEFVRVDHFHSDVYGGIWRAIGETIAAGRTADPVTLKETFHAGLLADTLNSAVYGPEIDDYARIIADMAQRRALMEAGRALATSAEDGSARDALFEHEAVLERIRQDGTTVAPIQTPADLIDDALEPEDDLVLSGIATLDQKIGGFERGGFTVIGGSTGMGKSAMQICVMANMARQNMSVGMISLDMTTRQVNRRLATYMGWLNPDGDKAVPTFRQVAERQCSERQLKHLRGVLQSDVARRIFIDDRGGTTTQDVDAQIRAWKRHCRKQGLPPLGAVFIDHIGHLYPARQVGDSLYQRVSQASNELMAVSKRHKDIATVVLCQLNKRALQAKDRPHLGDLRESGHIAQDASMVLLVHRHEWHLQQIIDNEMLDSSERGKAKSEIQFHRGKIETIIAKNRNGATGAVALKHSIAHNIIQDARSESLEEAA